MGLTDDHYAEHDARVAGQQADKHRQWAAHNIAEAANRAFNINKPNNVGRYLIGKILPERRLGL